MAKYLHSMIRVSDPEATVAFFKLIGVEEVRRFDNEKGRFTLIFLAAPGQEGVAEGQVYLHEPRVVVTNPVADDPKAELIRLQEAVNALYAAQNAAYRELIHR